MNKIITICVGLIVAGCATTTQLEETKGQLAAANAKIQDLEKNRKGPDPFVPIHGWGHSCA